MNSIIEKIKTPACIIFSLIIGIFLDRIYLDFPYLQLDPQINLLNVANLIIVIIIAFLIPSYVERIIEAKHDQIVFLIDDFKELLAIIKKIKLIISDAYISEGFSPSERNSIILTFNEAELKAVSIREQLESLFGNKGKNISNDLIDLLFEYNRFLTGGELMLSSTNQIDRRFYTENNTKHNKLETEIKKLIYKTYKF